MNDCCSDPSLIYKDSLLAENIPLSDSVRVDTAEDDEPISVNEYVVAKALRAIKISHAGGPDDLPNWVLKTYADILAAPIADILNCSFSECKVLTAWKLADFSKHLRPIFLTSSLPNVAKGFVIDMSLKPGI